MRLPATVAARLGARAAVTEATSRPLTARIRAVVAVEAWHGLIEDARQERADAIARALDEGIPAAELARLLHLSRQHVYRLAASARRPQRLPVAHRPIPRDAKNLPGPIEAP